MLICHFNKLYSHTFSFAAVSLLLLLLLFYHICLFLFFVHTCDLSLKYSEIQPKLLKHGAFPLVSVWLRHREPGNLHPYNFEA